MSCETAFRTAATHYLQQLAAELPGTCAGEANALHAMRVAMTRLKTTIALFSPMVDGDEQLRLGAELKWLNAHLGIVRDLDVALERLAKIKDETRPSDRPWKQERAACQRHLTRALRSPRYRRLIADLTAWIENGDWSRKRAKKAAELRSQPADQYCSDTLKAWRAKLLKKSRKLKEFGARKRHRVRLANKRLSYAIEFGGGTDPVRRNTGDAEAFTQSPEVARTVERRRAFPRARRSARRRQDGRKRVRARCQTKKAPAAKGDQRL